VRLSIELPVAQPDAVMSCAREIEAAGFDACFVTDHPAPSRTWLEHGGHATMDPFGGRFVFHGGEKDVVEGAWPGDVILIEFPDPASVRAWWESADYQAIKHLRTDHMAADIVLFESLPQGHRATDSLKKLLAS